MIHTKQTGTFLLTVGRKTEEELLLELLADSDSDAGEITTGCGLSPNVARTIIGSGQSVAPEI